MFSGIYPITLEGNRVASWNMNLQECVSGRDFDVFVSNFEQFLKIALILLFTLIMCLIRGRLLSKNELTIKPFQDIFRFLHHLETLEKPLIYLIFSGDFKRKYRLEMN